jgi:hypothetical protein
MNDPRRTPEIDSPRLPRAERRAAALVAEYIHELSDRHARTRRGEPGGRRQQPGSAIHTKDLTPREAREALGALSR